MDINLVLNEGHTISSQSLIIHYYFLLRITGLTQLLYFWNKNECKWIDVLISSFFKRKNPSAEVKISLKELNAKTTPSHLTR